MTILGKIFKTPLWILVLASYGASFYAAYTGLITSGWYVPGIYSTVLILYLIGMVIDKKKRAEAIEEPKVSVQELKDIEDEYQNLEQTRQAQQAEGEELNEVMVDEGDNYQR